MNGTWVEVRVITISEALEPIAGIFYGLDCKGVAIEDPNDILGREQGPLTWDFADINVLEHRGEAAVVKGYFSEEDNVEEIVTYIEEYDDRGHELDTYNTNAGWEDAEANDGTFMGMLMQKAADNSSRDYQLLYYDPRTHPHKSHK